MDHYFINNPNLKSNLKEISFKINNGIYNFITDNGVFSKNAIDYGTRTLIDNLPELKGNVLDFGCGYGVIGIYIKSKYNCNVDMIDINDRVIALAKKNALLNKVDVTIFKSNIYENVTNKYDYIVSNPPIRVGKKVLYEILFEAKKHLLPKGELWIVINKNQGAKTVAKDLEKEYEVKIIDKNKGFYVICAVNN